MGNLASTGQGALSGAAAGATLGSVVPGIGTAIGGIGGALLGGALGFGSNTNTPPPASGYATVNPATAGQYGTASQEGHDTVLQNQAFLQALQSQGGIQNQASAYGRQNALADTMGGGVQNQNAVFAQQQGLANQLQGMANGTGPNPAMAQLAQQTGANTANQAALMAGQRGAGANAGLLARQAAMQGGANQQMAVGQGATLQAQQQLAAINALQNQQGAMGNLANAQVGQQMGQNQALGAMAGQEVGQMQQGLGQATNAAQNQQQLIGNQINAQNNAGIAMQSNINNANAGLATGAQQIGANQQAGLMSGLGSAATALAKTQTPVAPSAPGGMGQTYQPGANGFANGGQVGPQSNAGKHLKGSPMFMAQGGQAPVVGEMLAAQGKQVPGQASVKGDSLKNDTVDAKLSPGEIVIPRSVVNSANPAKGAADFVAAILAKKGKK